MSSSFPGQIVGTEVLLRNDLESLAQMLLTQQESLQQIESWLEKKLPLEEVRDDILPSCRALRQQMVLALGRLQRHIDGMDPNRDPSRFN